MGKWLRRARGLAGLGVIGALVGGTIGGGITAVATLKAWGSVPTFNLLMGIMVGAFFGSSTTTGFGVLLAATSRGKTVEELSPWRAMAMSAAIGALVPVVLSALARGALQPLSVVASQIMAFGGFGAAIGGGLVVAAKKARRMELERSGDPPQQVE